jgi:predicted Zn-dependent protease with MMP-like domain
MPASFAPALRKLGRAISLALQVDMQFLNTLVAHAVPLFPRALIRKFRDVILQVQRFPMQFAASGRSTNKVTPSRSTFWANQ